MTCGTSAPRSWLALDARRRCGGGKHASTYYEPCRGDADSDRAGAVARRRG